jgi:hypothetical protein
MSETTQLAALRTDALLDAAVKGYRPWGELHVKAFWERYPECECDPRRLDAVGKAAYTNLLSLLRARLACVIRDARLLLATREQCGLDKSDLPELDAAVVAELGKMQRAHDDDRQEIREAALLEEKRRAARADEDDFDAALERHTEAMFDYANGEGPGPWFAAAREWSAE